MSSVSIDDLVTKRDEYFRAGIQEYWMVDPEEKKVTVLVPGKDGYKIHGEFTEGMVATSVLLPGFSVDVTSVFAAGAGPAQS
jgi:Uma2 family endonuclease